jgi:hypothetical protein
VYLAAADVQASDVIKAITDLDRGRTYFLLADGVDVFDLRTNSERGRIALPDRFTVDSNFECPPDMTVSPGGDVLVTSNATSHIWVIDHRTLKPTMRTPVLSPDRGRDIGFVRLQWIAREGKFIALTPTGKTWQIDADLRTAREVMSAAGQLRDGWCRG